jgi:hypothetical protein
MHTVPTASGNNVFARIRRMVVHGIASLFLIFGFRGEQDNDNPNPLHRAEICARYRFFLATLLARE